MRPILILLLVIVFAGAFLMLALVRDEADGGLMLGDDPSVPTLELYTAGGATTPQLPLWSAFAAGELNGVANVRVRFWKNLVALESLLLAGKGDLWVAHTEALALARAKGAPVALLVVSGWRKFSLVTTEPDLESFTDLAGKALPFAPRGSPAVPILEDLLRPDERPRFQPCDAEQLVNLLKTGRERVALLPEPLVTVVLTQVPGARIVCHLEDLYGERLGVEPRMPLAGIGVNLRTAARDPDLIRRVQAALVTGGVLLESSTPEQMTALLPPVFESFIPLPVVRRSLERDIVLVRTGAEVRPEVERFLRIVLPAVTHDKDHTSLDHDFFWH
jgi:NitT/TauT family transport system substrate-binding protein